MDETMGLTLEHDGSFRSRPVTRELIDSADLVLTAEAAHRARILEDVPSALRKVFTVGQFEAFAQQEPDLVGRELIEAAGRRRTAADPALDVVDPYRRGDVAAREAAGTMSRMLGVIVPQLLGRADG
jgi:sulfate adenylyltransferase